MDKNVLKRFKKGKFPERHEMTGELWFLMLVARNDGSAMEFLDSAYKEATELAKTDPEFRKEADKMTLQLHREGAEMSLDELADIQEHIRGNMYPHD